MRRMDNEERRRMCAACADADGPYTPCATCDWGEMCPAYGSRQEGKETE